MRNWRRPGWNSGVMKFWNGISGQGKVRSIWSPAIGDIWCLSNRKNRNSGAPEEAVDRRKQRRIMEAAGVYLALHGYSPDWRMRFDVAAIEGEQIRVIENAFGDGF